MKSILIKSLELVSREAVIRLKGFLKEYYQLTNERCLHYNPEDKFIAEKSKINSSVNKFIAFYAELNFNVYSSFLFEHNEEEIMKDKISLKKIIRYANTFIILYKVLYIYHIFLYNVLPHYRLVLADYNRIGYLLDNESEDFSIRHSSATKKTKTRKSIKYNNSQIIILNFHFLLIYTLYCITV